MYTLYLDKNEDFIAEVSVKNASLKNSKARLIMESSGGLNLVFNGKIEGGKCIVPIRRLKGILDENTIGKMILEIIVEDTYFSPWSDDYTTAQYTSIKVRVNEQKISSKPSVSVKVPVKAMPKPQKETLIPLYELSKLCERFDIRKSNLSKRHNDFRALIKEYFQSNPEYKNQKSSVLKALKYFIV
jgi:hypothetical protein